MSVADHSMQPGYDHLQPTKVIPIERPGVICKKDKFAGIVKIDDPAVAADQER